MPFFWWDKIEFFRKFTDILDWRVEVAHNYDLLVVILMGDYVG